MNPLEDAASVVTTVTECLVAAFVNTPSAGDSEWCTVVVVLEDPEPILAAL